MSMAPTRAEVVARRAAVAAVHMKVPRSQDDAGAKPRITGPRVWGGRLGSPIDIRLRCVSDDAVLWSASSLPDGIKLDASTGSLTGRVTQPGAYDIECQAKSSHGIDTRALRLVIGDAIALTPPMGWNSWNCWGKAVDEAKIRSAARQMVQSGLADHGFTYINIDDGWQGARCPVTGALMPNEKFPDMKGLCDYVHSLGLKIGIYSTPWATSYAGFPGGSGFSATSSAPHDAAKKFGDISYHAQDVRQFVEWGIDYLKYDWYPISVEHTETMSRELRSCGRDIVLSLSNSTAIELAPRLSQLAECWRTTGDIFDAWLTPPNAKAWEHSVTEIGFSQDPWADYAGPGHWNDADMLVVGRLGWGDSLHDSRLTVAEQRSHISLWCLLASPLLLGCDLAQLDDQTLALLTNDDVLAVNQDALGKQARRMQREGDVEIWAKPLESGGTALGIFNLGGETAKVRFVPSQFGIESDSVCSDLWRHHELEQIGEAICLSVDSHDVALLRFS